MIGNTYHVQTMGSTSSQPSITVKLKDGSTGTFTWEKEGDYHCTYSWNNYEIELDMISFQTLPCSRLFKVISSLNGLESLKAIEDWNWIRGRGPLPCLRSSEELLKWKGNRFVDSGVLVHWIMNPEVLFSLIPENEVLHVIRVFEGENFIELTKALREKGRNYIVELAGREIESYKDNKSPEALKNLKKYEMK